MSKFSKRNLLIFVAALLLGTLLIGFGIAYKIQLKQRILSGNSSNALRQSGPESAFAELAHHEWRRRVGGTSFSQNMIVHPGHSVHSSF